MDPRAARSTAARREAFQQFTQGRLERAYRLATLVLRDSIDAEDAVHDAAVGAWLNWDTLRDPGRLGAWFDRILVNECRARLRRRGASRITWVEPADRLATDPFASSGERDALRRALDQLGPEHRIVIVLRVVEDLSIAEIAARTGQREGTVKSRLHYGLSALRAAYDAAERHRGDS